MKITYLVTCSTETATLKRLLNTIYPVLGQDQLLILMDADTATKETKETIPTTWYSNPNVEIFHHSLNNDYGGHKNFGIEKAKGDFIFQIDGDELPPEALLGENLHALLESNPAIEAYAVPRINDFRGVADVHAKQWGWRLTTSPTYNRPIVNWPDYQWRIFKKDFPRIRFTRRLHEKIEGYGSFQILPSDETYALYHDKTIDTQIKTNLRYNQLFTQEENRGHSVFDKKTVDSHFILWDTTKQGSIPEFAQKIHPSKINPKHPVHLGKVVNKDRLFDTTYVVYFEEFFEK